MNLIDRDKLIEAHYDACNSDPNKSFYTWSLELMKNAPVINEWISVERELPENDIDKEYYIMSNSHHVAVGKYFCNGWHIGGEFVRYVVAWKPIEPYTGDKE